MFYCINMLHICNIVNDIFTYDRILIGYLKDYNNDML